LLDERDLSKLRWRCRRGLLENDLFIERFFKRATRRQLTVARPGLDALMDLADNDLLDLLLCAQGARGRHWTTMPEVSEVLGMLRGGTVPWRPEATHRMIGKKRKDNETS
jgi:antitoxin CptB